MEMKRPGRSCCISIPQIGALLDFVLGARDFDLFRFRAL